MPWFQIEYDEAELLQDGEPVTEPVIEPGSFSLDFDLLIVPGTLKTTRDGTKVSLLFEAEVVSKWKPERPTIEILHNGR